MRNAPSPPPPPKPWPSDYFEAVTTIASSGESYVLGYDFGAGAANREGIPAVGALISVLAILGLASYVTVSAPSDFLAFFGPDEVWVGQLCVHRQGRTAEDRQRSVTLRKFFTTDLGLFLIALFTFDLLACVP